MTYAKNTFVLFGINNIDKTCLYTESYICIGYTQANKQYIWVKRRTCCASKRRGPWASCYKTAWHLQWISHKSHYRIYTNLHQTFIKYLWTLERLVKTIRETLHDGSVYMTIWLTIKERLNYCGCKKKIVIFKNLLLFWFFNLKVKYMTLCIWSKYLDQLFRFIKGKSYGKDIVVDFLLDNLL